MRGGNGGAWSGHVTQVSLEFFHRIIWLVMKWGIAILQTCIPQTAPYATKVSLTIVSLQQAHFRLQNSTLTWHTDDPRLTQCFEDTLIAWLPAFLLFICVPFQLFWSVPSFIELALVVIDNVPIKVSMGRGERRTMDVSQRGKDRTYIE